MPFDERGLLSVCADSEELVSALHRFVKEVIYKNDNSNDNSKEPLLLYIVSETCKNTDDFWNHILEVDSLPPTLFITFSDTHPQGCLEFLREGMEGWETWNPSSGIRLKQVLQCLACKRTNKQVNPFKDIQSKYEIIRSWFGDNRFLEKDSYNFLQEVGRTQERTGVRGKHGHGSFEDSIRLQVFDLLKAIIRKRAGLKVLLLENNPGRLLRSIDERFEKILKTVTKKNLKENTTLGDAIQHTFSLLDNSSIYIYKEQFSDLYNKLIGAKQKKQNKFVFDCNILSEGNMGRESSISSQDLDMILVDIFLAEKTVNGVDFVNVLREVCPHIPTFILSSSSDYDTIQKAFSKGADIYVIKNQVFSLPYLYHAYINNMGKLIHNLKGEDRKLSKNLLGNLRYWNFKRNYLWYGDKCYHIVDHSFPHMNDNWTHSNKILVPLLRSGILEDQILIPEQGNQKLTTEQKDKLIYSFSMATWLHDIGHKGTHRYGEPYLIRDTHSVISGELILAQPKSFGIVEDEDYNASLYKDLLYPAGKCKKPVTQILLEQVEKNGKLSITELIALISIYHQSKAPLNDADYYRMVRKDKFIPADFFENTDPQKDVITLERIVELIKEENEENSDLFKKNLLSLIALFRFIDGIDNKVSRVGDPFEEKLKRWVIDRDLEYNYKKLFSIVEKMSWRFSNDPIQQASFIKSFFADVKEKIIKQESVSINELSQYLGGYKEWEEYVMIMNFCYFLGATEGHYYFHSSIADLQIKYEGGRCFRLSMLTNKSEAELEERKMFEVGKETQSVLDRLIGENCYILKELRSGQKYLSGFLNRVTIELRNSQTGKLYDKPQVWHSQ